MENWMTMYITISFLMRHLLHGVSQIRSIWYFITLTNYVWINGCIPCTAANRMWNKSRYNNHIQKMPRRTINLKNKHNPWTKYIITAFITYTDALLFFYYILLTNTKTAKNMYNVHVRGVKQHSLHHNATRFYQ